MRVKVGNTVSDSDPEPAYLEISNTYTFWVVATDMNKKVLVPK